MSDLPQRISQLVERQNVLDARISAIEKLMDGELKDLWETVGEIAAIFQAQVSFNEDIIGLLAPAFPEVNFTEVARAEFDRGGSHPEFEPSPNNREGGE